MEKKGRYHILEAVHDLAQAQLIMIGLQSRLAGLENTKSAAYIQRAIEWTGKAKDELLLAVGQKKEETDG